MKQPLTTLECMDKACGHEINSHRIMDGLKCEKCGGPTLTYPGSRDQKAYIAGIKKVNSNLTYDLTFEDTVTFTICLTARGEGFEALGKAYTELVNDVEKLLRESRGE